MTGEMQFGVVLVTVPSKSQGMAIAQSLVEAKLAACVSLVPICSIYTWNGAVQTEDEWQLLIKSELSKFAALEAKIRSIHSYEVPEIIALPIVAATPAYLQWIAASLKD